MKIRKVGIAALKGSVAKKPSARAPAIDDSDYSLATELSKSVENLSEYIVWFFGEPGTGKSSTAAQFPATHHFMVEAGGKSIPCFQKPTLSWRQFRGQARMFRDAKQFKTGVIDGVEHLYKMCFDHMCRVMAIEHPNDANDRGKSWSRISDEFVRGMSEFMSIPGKGTVLVGHAIAKELKALEGANYEQVVPNMTEKMMKTLHGVVDIAAFLYHDGHGVCCRIRPDGHIMAKCRPNHKFLWTSGEPIQTFRMGDSPEEGYRQFVAAFENRLEKPAEVKRALVKKTLVKKKEK